MSVYKILSLVDLCGIKLRNAARLNSVGIFSVEDFYRASIKNLKAAFSSITGYYWHLRLRGWEIDDVEFGRRSYGNSYALPKPLATAEELSPILTKLVTKMSARLRRAGYKSSGMHVAISYRNGLFWHRGVRYQKCFFDTREIYKEVFKIFCSSPHKKPIRELAVSCFNLSNSGASQLELFDDIYKKRCLSDAIDNINEKWGDFVITPAKMVSVKGVVPDRIAFGGVKELEEFTLLK